MALLFFPLPMEKGECRMALLFFPSHEKGECRMALLFSPQL